MTSQNTLRIDASARKTGSTTRSLTDQVIAKRPRDVLQTLDLLDTPVPQIDETWIGANFTPAADRTEAQNDRLALSDKLVGQLVAADTVVIGLPIYNFGVPASLKAWIDHVARAGLTFHYTAEGPRGLLKNKKAILVIASGGTQIGSDIDFATDYMKHVLGFLGIEDVTVVGADRMVVDPDAALAAATAQVDALAA
jgi:FMN-dependent NADH-azoreductase